MKAKIILLSNARKAQSVRRSMFVSWAILLAFSRATEEVLKPGGDTDPLEGLDQQIKPTEQLKQLGGDCDDVEAEQEFFDEIEKALTMTEASENPCAIAEGEKYEFKSCNSQKQSLSGQSQWFFFTIE